MEKNKFEKSIDQTRLNKLRGEILAFVSDYEEKGYANMEIARALVWVGLKRSQREGDLSVSENFYHFLRDIAVDTLAREHQTVREATAERLKNEIN